MLKYVLKDFFLITFVKLPIKHLFKIFEFTLKPTLKNIKALFKYSVNFDPKVAYQQ